MRFPFYGGPLDGDERAVLPPVLGGGLSHEYHYAMPPQVAAADYACTTLPPAADTTPVYRYILRRRVCDGRLVYVLAGLCTE